MEAGQWIRIAHYVSAVLLQLPPSALVSPVQPSMLHLFVDITRIVRHLSSFLVDSRRIVSIASQKYSMLYNLTCIPSFLVKTQHTWSLSWQWPHGLIRQEILLLLSLLRTLQIAISAPRQTCRVLLFSHVQLSAQSHPFSGGKFVGLSPLSQVNSMNIYESLIRVRMHVPTNKYSSNRTLRLIESSVWQCEVRHIRCEFRSQQVPILFCGCRHALVETADQYLFPPSFTYLLASDARVPSFNWMYHRTVPISFLSRRFVL